MASLQRQELLQTSTSVLSSASAAAKLTDPAESRAQPDLVLTDDLLADQMLADEAELGLDSQRVRTVRKMAIRVGCSLG